MSNVDREEREKRMFLKTKGWPKPKDHNFKESIRSPYISTMQLNSIQLHAMSRILNQNEPFNLDPEIYVDSIPADCDEIANVPCLAADRQSEQSLQQIFDSATVARSGVVIMPPGSGKTALAAMLMAFIGTSVKYFCKPNSIGTIMAYIKRWSRIAPESKYKNSLTPQLRRDPSYCVDIVDYDTLCSYNRTSIKKDVVIFDDFDQMGLSLVEIMATLKGSSNLVLVFASQLFEGFEQFGDLLFHAEQNGCTMAMTESFFSHIPFQIEHEDYTKEELVLMMECEDIALFNQVYNLIGAHEKAGHKILVTGPERFGKFWFTRYIQRANSFRYHDYRGMVNDAAGFENREIQTFFVDDSLIGVGITSLPVFDCFIQIGVSTKESTRARLKKFFTGIDLGSNQPPTWTMRMRKGYFYELTRQGQAPHVLQSLQEWKEESGMDLWNFHHEMPVPAKFPNLSKKWIKSILKNRVCPEAEVIPNLASQ